MVDLENLTNSSEVSLPDLEKKVLDFWQLNNAFETSIRKSAKPYIFYDGPPFATGLPHHGHLLASTIKDIIARYYTMKDYCVERRFGWDCHGLPIEHEIDKQQNMPTYQLVEKIGVAGYNELCKNIVQLYTSQWQETITKLGRWVDFENDYKTMDPDFMESVWWVFNSLWDKGLIYKGTKVVPYSTALSTGLSNFEAGSNYQDVQDPSLYVLFELTDSNASLLVWTTTPWTLPANLGICVGPEIEYCLVKYSDKFIWVAKNRKDFLFEGCEVIKQCFGKDLVNLQYKPLFDYFAKQSALGAFRIHVDDFVSVDDGTGLVHMAPAFGEDDHRIMSATNVEVVCPVDDNGCFTKEVLDFYSLHVKKADKEIIKYLKSLDKVFKHDTIVHSYPHCPRSDTPLIYKAIPSWYIEVTSLKDRLLAANEKINWVPSHVKHGRFGKWLENAKDWAVSRNRVWGTPVPLWINDVTQNIKCIASKEELFSLSGKQVTDLHRHNVDDIEFSIPGEPGMYKRVDEVLDCWFESGAMPYAQNHYPFENKDKFELGFPAAFIAEGLDQTRGWFYTLTVLSVALFDKPAFTNVIVSGIVAAEDGKKMSKRLKNYTQPIDLIEKYGADALRLYLINSGLVKGQEQRFKDQGVKDMVRHTILPWYNAAKFLLTYAQVDKWNANLQDADYTILDLWLHSRLQSLKNLVNKAMGEYKLYLVVPELLKFLDELTNIYIRFNRSRFWAEGMSKDKQAAYFTLYTAVKEFNSCMAPFAPFCAEAIYQLMGKLDLKFDKNSSVHYQDFPVGDKSKVNVLLEQAVLRMYQVVILGRQCRNDAKIKNKIPLNSVTIIHKDKNMLAEIAKLERIILQELNVKKVIYENNESDFISLRAQPCSPILGKRFGKKFGEIRKLIESMSLDQILLYEKQGSIMLGYNKFVATEINVLRQAKAGVQNIASNSWVSVCLDCNLSQDLIDHGLAREIINRIQKTRKEMQLHVSDRICVEVYTSEKIKQIINQHQLLIKTETLTTKIDFVENVSDSFEYDVEGERLKLLIKIA